MVSNRKFREKLQKRLAEVQSETSERESGATATITRTIGRCAGT